jgi:hypothetical protein
VKTFPSAEVTNWIESEGTAICPHCGVDSIIGDASGFPIETEFLEKMEAYWFGLRN